jgi:hypothetical protein
MKRRKDHQDLQQTVIVNVNLTRGLVTLLTLAMLTVAFLGYLVWGHEEVAASSPQAPLAASIGAREYYLTASTYSSTSATTACDSGYHMASLWEILNPSGLEYNTTLGTTRADSGSGPPSFLGWARTGYSSNNDGSAGQANCSAWSTTAGNGTAVRLPQIWDTDLEDMHVWQVQLTACTSVARVWCIED